VDWNFVADHRRLQTLNTANAMPDNHGGQDTLYWGIDPAGTGPGNDPTHDNSDLGTFGNVGNYDGLAFRTVDVFGLTTRYSDYDQDGGAFNLKESALDYDLFFKLLNGTVVPGTPILDFQFGWTANTNADNYLLRWQSPGDAIGVFIEANNGLNHEGVSQIDAIIASDFVPEPASGALLVAGIGLSARRRHHSRKLASP
jgi:hypothetical protein